MKNERWSHYNGRPTQMEKMMMVLLWWVTYPEKIMMENGRVVMGDLPRKNVGLIVMGDLPKKMMVLLWWVTYPEKRWWGLKGTLERR
jgi:hypothetical protein